MGKAVAVEVVGRDRGSVNRVLNRTESRIQQFGRRTNSTLNNLGAGGLLGRGGAALAGGSLLTLAFKDVVAAGQEAEVTLGQTQAAVEAAGLSWQLNAKRINDGAQQISEAASLDDEDVLRAFQLFVRGQGDVQKSLKLTALAADVARGRQIDLASAAMLVNKAAMGQLGALRRVGIQIDSNATSTEALALLQQKYAGAADAYSRTSAGAIDRLNKALEDTEEILAGPLLDAVADFATTGADLLGTVNDLATGLGDLRDKLNELVPGFGAASSGASKFFDLIKPGPDMVLGPYQFPYRVWQMFRGGGTNTEGLPGAYGAGMGPQGGLPPGRQALPPPPSLVTQLPNRLVQDLLDAQIGGNTNKILSAYRAQKAFLERALGQRNLTRQQRTDLKQDLLSVIGAIDSIESGIAAAAQAAKQAKSDAAAKIKAGLEAGVQASIDAANTLAEAAQAAKDKLIAQLDRAHDKVEIGRDIAEARRELAKALIIGAPGNIAAARADLDDALYRQRRWALEGASPQMIQSLVINVNGGNASAEAIADMVLRKLNQRTKKNTSQPRGRHPGHNLLVAK